VTGQPTLLAVLLEDKGWQRYGSFRAAYEKAVRSLDREHGGSSAPAAPSSTAGSPATYAACPTPTIAASLSTC